MISQQNKIDTLNKVLSSTEFSQSTKSQDLLKYLVDASLRNSDVNEIKIATEFFGKNSNLKPILKTILIKRKSCSLWCILICGRIPSGGWRSCCRFCDPRNHIFRQSWHPNWSGKTSVRALSSFLAPLKRCIF